MVCSLLTDQLRLRLQWSSRAAAELTVYMNDGMLEFLMFVDNEVVSL